MNERQLNRTDEHAFTIVELVVVIVVIVILVAITTVGYTKIQTQAQATSLADGIVKTEDSMTLWQVRQGNMTWPNNSNFNDPNSDGNNPTLLWMIANTDLGQYLPKLPDVTGIDTSDWEYDWDNNPQEMDLCTNPNASVNIFVSGVKKEVVQQIDDMIDDGDINCGRVRYAFYHNEDRLNYKLSGDGTINR